VTTTTVQENHGEHTHDVARSQRLGVFLLILADAVFVFGLVFTYFYLRGLNTDGAWIGKGDATVSPAWNWLIAAVVVLSALAYQWGEHRGRAGDRRSLSAGTTVALALVVADLAIQVWRILVSPGTVGNDAYASITVTMGAAHVFHLLLTLFVGLAIWFRVRRGLTDGIEGKHATLVGYWWMWVAGSAVIIAFTTSFVSV
jgi:heme/copper-type cytochrome/quinol oxidase subunit 3